MSEERLNGGDTVRSAGVVDEIRIGDRLKGHQVPVPALATTPLWGQSPPIPDAKLSRVPSVIEQRYTYSLAGAVGRLGCDKRCGVLGIGSPTRNEVPLDEVLTRWLAEAKKFDVLCPTLCYSNMPLTHAEGTGQVVTAVDTTHSAASSLALLANRHGLKS